MRPRQLCRAEFGPGNCPNDTQTAEIPPEEDENRRLKPAAAQPQLNAFAIRVPKFGQPVVYFELPGQNRGICKRHSDSLAPNS